MDSRKEVAGGGIFFFSHQNVITYACITIRIRYVNQFGIILLAANDIYLIIANAGILLLCEKLLSSIFYECARACVCPCVYIFLLNVMKFRTKSTFFWKFK